MKPDASTPSAPDESPGEFYIGWEDVAPPGLGRRVRVLVVGLLSLTLALAFAAATTQRTIGVSNFEWGKLKTFSGYLYQHPYPHLLVPRPAVTSGQDAFSTYYLVNPFKHGFTAPQGVAPEGNAVALQGTLIYRDTQTMIEVAPDSLKALEPGRLPPPPASAPTATRLGRQTLIGEIVDSKCYLGVMNPGQYIPHRACAIRCISGGIPPLLLVRQPDGPALHFLLVDADGGAVNERVLELVAEPVEITGEVERTAGLLILRADPATYRRVGHATPTL